MVDVSPPGGGRAAILVLGMHRSGTSALTRLLGHVGAAMPGDGIAAHADNARGYWEPQALVRVDDRILRTARTSWFDPRPLDLGRIPADVAAAHRHAIREAIGESFGDAPLIAVKDPRQCRLVPIVRAALAEGGIASRAIVMLRSPEAVARSLHARDRMTPAYAHALWLRHMIDAERDSRDLPRAIVGYDDLMRDWRDAMARMAGVAGRPGWTPSPEDEAAIAAHLDPSLRHHEDGRSTGLEPGFAAIVEDIYDAFRMLARQDDAAARDRLNAATARYDGDRHLLDDIIHDELRHRRHDALQAPPPPEIVSPSPPEPEPEAMTEAEPQPTPPTAASAAPPESSLAYEIGLVNASGLFDTAWYLARYPEVASMAMDPIEHYLTIGAPAGYDPSPLFQTTYYARQMARRDAAERGDR